MRTECCLTFLEDYQIRQAVKKARGHGSWKEKKEREKKKKRETGQNEPMYKFQYL